MADQVGYGLIGAGAFGQFCLEQYKQMDEVRVVAIADVQQDAASAAAKKQGVEASPSVEALLDRDDIGFVHIATPPFTHRSLVFKALERGKHVLCEKPLATTREDAEAMIDQARELKRVLAVNLIMRYNPLCEAVKRVIDDQLLGEPLHGFFENYAKDEPLPPNHWFWQKQKSGGIFIEHGVHFFDLFRWWLGEGEVVAAQRVGRPGADFTEQVQATLRYRPSDAAGDVYVNHYHGFTQASLMDRQEMRIVCERGTIRLDEWVPTHVEVDCLATREIRGRLLDILPDAEVESEHVLEGEARSITSRHKRYEVDGRYRITGSPGMGKQALYGHVIRELLRDQIAAAREPDHRRRITEANGLRSLLTAVEADRLASPRP